MANLVINNYFIKWRQSFLTNKWVKLIIDEYVNLNQKVEIKIPKQLLISPIFFWFTLVVFFHI